MWQCRTPEEVAGEVWMGHTQHRGAYLIVEGSTDASVFRRFVQDGRCLVIPANGKECVLRAIEILERRRLCSGVVAIVDADFTRIDKVTTWSVNILVTDTHDLETMILKSPALDRVLGQFGDREVIDALPKGIRRLLLDSGLPVGILRLMIGRSRREYAADLSRLPFCKFVEGPGLAINVDKLIAEVQAQPGSVNLDAMVIKKKIAALLTTLADQAWQVCRGHDLVHILWLGLRQTFGNARGKRLASADPLEWSLRDAYSEADFRQTALHAGIHRWEEAHPPYRVLALPMRRPKTELTLAPLLARLAAPPPTPPSVP